MVWDSGVEVAGGSRIIENAYKSYDFYGFGLWGGGAQVPQNERNCMKIQRFSWFWIVGGGARMRPAL